MSHQQIEAAGTNKRWTRVLIRDVNAFNNDNLEFEANWSVKDLKVLVLFIADQYTVEITRISTKAKPPRSNQQ